MGGVGRSSTPTPPISRSPPISRKTASAATFRHRTPTGFTSADIRFSARSEQHARQTSFLETRRSLMRNYLLFAIVGTGLISAGLWPRATPAVAAQSQGSSAMFTPDGKVKLPTGFRSWVFVGAPLTPNGLNNGMANFPEFHHVYVEKKNVDAYLQTGVFPEGTVFVKELTRLLAPTFPDGSRKEPSGRGFFNGELNGIDMTVKDSKRFTKTNGWGFFTFGHHPRPYETTAA